MTISRRGFIAGLAITGAAAPAAFYGHRELTRVDEPVTPGEATVDLADTAGQQLADQLRGLWTIRFNGRDAGLDGLPSDDLEMWLDIAPRGRGVRGYLDTAQVLHSQQTPRYRILGDLVEPDAKHLHWRLTRSDAPHGVPDYELSFSLDEVWGMYGNAGSGTLSGRVQRLDRPLALPEQDNHVVALKRTFPEARERIGLNPSLLAWLEFLKIKGTSSEYTNEIEKDIQRLQTITDRFSKIGSAPSLKKENVRTVMQHSIDYIRTRSSDKVTFSLEAPAYDIQAPMNVPLFEWVVENILKNALDAMEGNGRILVMITDQQQFVYIDISDTGKGVPKSSYKTIFKPGFTTKNRGWGLGLSLSKRIIEEYHDGQIFVKSSEIGKGTTFRIVLKK